MQYCDAVTAEVGDVEGQDPADPVDQHHGDEPGVVDPITGNLVEHHQPPPVVIDPRVVGQQDEDLFDPLDGSCRRGDVEAKAVMRRRSRRGRPEFRDVLRRHMNRLAAVEQPVGADDGVAVVGMRRFEPAQQHIGVDEHAHSCRPPGKWP
jgi:hypothetical protein